MSDLATRRLAITMWDFSWLLRREGQEAEYADWDRVLDALALRGYDCVRLDAFPHLIAKDAGGTLVEEFTALPQRRRFPWGNHRLVRVNPREGLVVFIRKAAERGICVGLSTWLTGDLLGRCRQVRTPADFARIWQETLAFLDAESLLSNVAWVDLCNEFPMGQWARGAYPQIFGTPWWNFGALLCPWREKARQAVQRYLEEPIRALRAAFPGLRYTFSFEPVGAKGVRSLDISAFDLLEPHVWLSSSVPFAISSGQVLALLEAPRGIPLHARRAPSVYWRQRERWIGALAEHMDFWAAWAREKKLPLYTTEAWGPVNYDDVSPEGSSGEWKWVKDICAEGVRLAVEKGWRGVCTSNFCQPHFEGMWADVGWHQEMTREIRGQ